MSFHKDMCTEGHVRLAPLRYKKAGIPLTFKAAWKQNANQEVGTGSDLKVMRDAIGLISNTWGGKISTDTHDGQDLIKKQVNSIS